MSRRLLLPYPGIEIQVRTKGTLVFAFAVRYTSAIDIVTRHFHGRSSSLPIPYIVPRRAINRRRSVGSFTHARGLIRGGSARTNARMYTRPEHVRGKKERSVTAHSREGAAPARGVLKALSDILSYRGGSFKRANLRSRGTLYFPAGETRLPSVLGIIEIGAPDAREAAGDRTVGTARLYRYFCIRERKTTLRCCEKRREIRSASSRMATAHTVRGDKRMRRG